MVWMESKDLEGLNINFGGGFHKKAGLRHTWAAGHAHSCSEILFFLGIDPTDIAYFGGEVAVEFGEEQEEHLINESSVVVIPGGLLHDPFTALRLGKPHLQYHFVLASEYEVKWMPKETKPPKSFGTKYAHLIKHFKTKGILKRVNMREITSGSADQMVFFNGRNLNGSAISFSWGVHSNCGVWWLKDGLSKTHINDFDQMLVFVGLNPGDINYLGAEIELHIGDERHEFSSSTAVILPKNLHHGPITTKWVDRPFGCLALSFSPEYIVNFEPL